MEKQNNLFFTIWYGVFCRSKRLLKYSSAGHPPALLIRDGPGGERATEQLQGVGPFIGAVSNYPFRTHECAIPYRSLILVLSDGTYEIQKSDGTILEFSEFVETVVRPNDETGCDLDRILETVLKLHGSGSLDDDFSIMKCEFTV
jgi:sigma-B regulation protein RsbU (phosphoserine phosphatase)